jgi:hypothetical protein
LSVVLTDESPSSVQGDWISTVTDVRRALPAKLTLAEISTASPQLALFGSNARFDTVMTDT